MALPQRTLSLNKWITSETARRETRAAPMMAPTLHSVVTRTEGRNCRWEAMWADRYAETVGSAPATESDRPHACLKGVAAMSKQSAAMPTVRYAVVSMPILCVHSWEAHQMSAMTAVHRAAQAARASCAPRNRAARGDCSAQDLAIFRDDADLDCPFFAHLSTFMSGGELWPDDFRPLQSKIDA